MTYGVTLTASGAHFAARSVNAKTVYVCLYEGEREVKRLAMQRKTAERHEVLIPGVREGQHYGLRADGVWNPSQGQCFDVSKLLIDPYATEISAHAKWDERLAQFGEDTAALVPKSVVRAPLKALTPLPRRQPKLIYELPVKAFTKLHPDVPTSQRGTVAALTHPAVIAHLKVVGCDTIELMPIAAWTDERHLARAGLRNSWGYNSISFLAADPDLAPGGSAEVREAVRVLHQHGFRVLLDVVYNHTGESDFGGGTFSLRGLDHASYFRMKNGALINDSGCGNTLALDQSASVDLVLASLRHWATQCGIDGFRYDLATVMGRSETGFSQSAPLIDAVRADDILGNLVHIAEPWDVGPGGYQLGNFPDDWLEWNDHFRDDIRRFWRGDAGAHRNFATRLAGSSDFFKGGERKPSSSVNFVAAHDGFALGDVVRHARKENHANGEDNRDGSDGEVCWVDGNPQAKVIAMLASVFLARGTIMLTAGDEFGRTQNGNNNAYAQDNEVTWLDWKKTNSTLTKTVSSLLELREAKSEYFSDAFLDDTDVIWTGPNGTELAEEGWSQSQLQVFGMILKPRSDGPRLAILFSRAGAISEAHLTKQRVGFTWRSVWKSQCVAVFHEMPMTEKF